MMTKASYRAQRVFVAEANKLLQDAGSDVAANPVLGRNQRIDLVRTDTGQAALLEVGRILNALSADDRWYVMSIIAAIRRSRIEEARRG